MIEENVDVWNEYLKNRNVDENFYDFVKRTCICFNGHTWRHLHKQMFEEWFNDNINQFSHKYFYNFLVKHFPNEMSKLKPNYNYTYSQYVFK